MRAERIPFLTGAFTTLDGKYTQTPLKIHKIHSVFDLETNTQIHQGGVFSPPSSKYTKYTVYLVSGGNTLNTYFPSRASTPVRGDSYSLRLFIDVLSAVFDACHHPTCTGRECSA